MRVALLHLELSGGTEKKNIKVLQKAILLAAQANADWVITPEMAVQGYYFQQKNYPGVILPQPSKVLQPICTLAAVHKLAIFLGCGEKDEENGNCYNSCLVINTKGEVAGRHRKLRAHGSAEDWAAKGTELEPVVCDEMSAGVLVCADSYYPEYAQELQGKGAQVLVVPAAWPPGLCGDPPAVAWARCSALSGLPLWVCNQTGNQEKMDFSQAQSMVFIAGKAKLEYYGLQQAVLLFDWDQDKCCLSGANSFEIVPF